MKGTELSGEENDAFLLDDLVSLDSAKDSDNVIDRGVRAGSVFGVKWQAGKGAAFHGFAQLPFDQGGHHETDDRLHPENHQRLRQLLQASDFIYVADCKLATAENLGRI